MSGPVVKVAGFCPACGRDSLFVGEGGYIVCSKSSCPNPCAAADLLEDGETQHIAHLDADGFTLRHPLFERLGDALMTCNLHARIAAMDGPPRVPGRYRVHWMKSQRGLGVWERLDAKDGEQ